MSWLQTATAYKACIICTITSTGRIFRQNVRLADIHPLTLFRGQPSMSSPSVHEQLITALCASVRDIVHLSTDIRPRIVQLPSVHELLITVHLSANSQLSRTTSDARKTWNSRCQWCPDKRLRTWVPDDESLRTSACPGRPWAARTEARVCNYIREG